MITNRLQSINKETNVMRLRGIYIYMNKLACVIYYLLNNLQILQLLDVNKRATLRIHRRKNVKYLLGIYD